MGLSLILLALNTTLRPAHQKNPAKYGKHGNNRNVTVCPGPGALSPCPEGYYCPTPSEAKICPKGSYCPLGSFKPQKCELLFFNDYSCDRQGQTRPQVSEG